MYTDRMILGPPRAGTPETPAPQKEVGVLSEKGQESFKHVMQKAAHKPDETPKPQNSQAGKQEGGFQKKNDLSVKTESKTVQGKSSPPKTDPMPWMSKGVALAKSELPNPTLNLKSELDTMDRLASSEVDLESAVPTDLRDDIEIISAGPKDCLKNADVEAQVMQEFMDSMESKFGIPPTKIVEAMTDLEPEDMLQPAEDLASQLFKKLDLPTEQSAQAQAMYVAMLHKLTALDNTPTAHKVDLVEATERGHAQQKIILLSMLTSKVKMEGLVDSSGQKRQWIELTEAEKTQVRERLAKLASELLQGPQPESSREENLAALMGLESLKELQDAEVAPNAVPLNPESLAYISTLEAPPTARPPAAVVVNGYRGIKDEPAEMAVDPNRVSQNQPLTKLNPVTSQMNGPQAAEPATPAWKGFAAPKPEAARGPVAAMKSETSSGGQSQGGTSDGSFSGNGADPNLLASSGSGQSPMISKDTGAFAGALGSAGPLLKSSANKENVQQVIQQAQYVIKQGGGDAIVKMSSETLGDVHLKVSVADGKVSVQMATSSREAKDLLESSMKELKNSIGAHNLKIDHIKVDVGNQMSQDSGTSSHKDSSSMTDRRDFQQGQNRGSSQETFRQAFSEGQSGSRERKPTEDLADLRTAVKSMSRGAAAAGRYVGQGRGTGLNLVA